MYLPAAELQQYKGNWVCPYCLMDMKEDDRKMEKPPKEYKPEKYVTSPLSYEERCQRCGRETEILYMFNERKLCKSCLEDEQHKWSLVGGKPSSAAYKITRVKYEKKEGFFSSIINRLLERIGLKRRRPRDEFIEAIKKEAQDTKEKPTNIVSFKRSRPLMDAPEKEKEEIKIEEEKLEPKAEKLIITRKVWKKTRKNLKMGKSPRYKRNSQG